MILKLERIVKVWWKFFPIKKYFHLAQNFSRTNGVPPSLYFVSHVFLESLRNDIETNAWKIRTAVPPYKSEWLAPFYSHYPINRGTVFQTNDWCPDNNGASCAEIHLFDNLFQPDQTFISGEGQGLASKTYRRKDAVQACKIIRLGGTSGGLQFSPLLKARWAVRSDQVALSSTQSGLENERWKLHKLYDQTIPFLGSPHSRLWCSSEGLFPRLSSQSRSSSSQDKSSSLPDYLVFTWTPSSLSIFNFFFFFVLGLDAVSLMSAKWKGIITFLNLLTRLLLKQPIPNPCCKILVHL